MAGPASLNSLLFLLLVSCQVGWWLGRRLNARFLVLCVIDTHRHRDTDRETENIEQNLIEERRRKRLESSPQTQTQKTDYVLWFLRIHSFAGDCDSKGASPSQSANYGGYTGFVQEAAVQNSCNATDKSVLGIAWEVSSLSSIKGGSCRFSIILQSS